MYFSNIPGPQGPMGPPSPLDEERDTGTLTRPPSRPGHVGGGDLSVSPEEPDPYGDAPDTGGIGEKPSGYKVSSGLSDILPTGLMGIASLISKNSDTKEGLAQLAKGFGDEKMGQITKGKQDQHDNDLALIKDAHMAWQEIHGMDIAHMPPAVKTKVMQLNETYNKALQDGKISSKEALEISAYAGMVKRAVNAGKQDQDTFSAEEKGRNAVRGDFAGRVQQQEYAAMGDPARPTEQGDLERRAGSALSYDLNKGPRADAAKAADLRNKIEVAEIRSRNRVRAAMGGKPADKRQDQLFRTYLTQVNQAKQRAASTGDDPSAEIEAIEDQFMQEYGRVPGKAAAPGGLTGDRLGLGAPPSKGSNYQPGGAPLR